MHRQPWPTVSEVAVSDGEVRLLVVVGDALSQVRKAKSEAKVSMRTDVATVAVRGTPDDVGLVTMAADDLRSAGKIGELTFDSETEVSGLEVAVTL